MERLAEPSDELERPGEWGAELETAPAGRPEVENEPVAARGLPILEQKSSRRQELEDATRDRGRGSGRELAERISTTRGSGLSSRSARTPGSPTPDGWGNGDGHGRHGHGDVTRRPPPLRTIAV